MDSSFPTRPLHFITDLSGVTLCGKERTRVRYTSVLRTWNNPLVAPSRRCKECGSALAVRASREKGEG